MNIGLHIKYRIFFSGFSKTCTFSTDFSKNNQISKFHENPSLWEPSAEERSVTRTERPKDGEIAGQRDKYICVFMYLVFCVCVYCSGLWIELDVG